MGLSNLEKYWMKKRIVKYFITVAIFLLYGDRFVRVINSLDGIDEITVKIIVFSGISVMIWTLIDYLDNSRVGR